MWTTTRSGSLEELYERKSFRPSSYDYTSSLTIDYTLSHLDAVRCLAFDRSERNEDVCMATGSDDCTVKLWRVPLQSISAM